MKEYTSIDVSSKEFQKMNSSRLVRGAKTRMFACLCLISVLGALVYVFHGTQSRLADVQKIASECSQQQESLSAQLQVIFEYKSRLEKSLKKEKEDHNLTKSSCKAREKEDREAREKEKVEAANKYEALVQQSKLEKSQIEDEKESLRREMDSLKIGKKELQNMLAAAKEELQKVKTEKDDLKKEVLRVEEEKRKVEEAGLGKEGVNLNKEIAVKECKEELEKVNVLLKDCQLSKKTPSALPMQSPAAPLEPPKASLKGNSSTTPGINPDALYSPEPSPEQRLEQLKPDNQVALPQVAVSPNKATQESGAAGGLIGGGGLLGGVGGPNGLPGQIPGPPDPLQQSGRDERDRMQDERLGPLNPMAEEKRVDAAVEEEDGARQREIPRGRAGGESHYHGGDYDKEQPEEEEDEEGEQLDYVQANDQMRKEMRNNGPGVMLNPK